MWSAAMSQRPTVAVIGAGFSGLLTALLWVVILSTKGL